MSVSIEASKYVLIASGAKRRGKPLEYVAYSDSLDLLSACARTLFEAQEFCPVVINERATGELVSSFGIIA